MKDRNTKIIIAEKNKKIIGYFMGAIEKAPSYVISKEIGVIFDAFIEKEYRNKGVGKKIFKELLKWFKKKKVKHIELTVDARNKIGLSAWKRFGFFDFRLKMRLDL
jgi:GNAT superfamily N-acetyltransferase